MDKNELSNVLAQFAPGAGSQLKYYIILSLFPELSSAEAVELGGFNRRSFVDIQKAVKEKNLPLLHLPREEDKELKDTLVAAAPEALYIEQEDTLQAELEKEREQRLYVEDVAHKLRDERDVQRETIERLTAELGTLKKRNVELLTKVDQLAKENRRLAVNF